MPTSISTEHSTDNIKNIKLLSTEVKDIISQKPSWLVRNGMLLFLLIIVLLVSTTFLINYPDVVNTNATLLTINTPKEIKVKTDGKLIKLFTKENQYVAQNDILGYIESNAAHNEIISLSKLLDTLHAITENNIAILPQYIGNVYSNLGELQQPYQVFKQSFSLFTQYISTGYFIKKKSMLITDIGYLKQLQNNLSNQKSLQIEDLSLADKNFNASSTLNEDKVIADVEFRNEKSKLISKKLSIPQINASIISNESSIHEKQKEIAQLENEIAQQKGIFIQALNTFQAQINEWKKKYLLTAPIAGNISFNYFLEENIELKQGQTFCFINPNNTEYYANVFIPQTNFGKVKIGGKVILKIKAYPFQEFGTVEGKLEFIAKIPTDSGYTAKVILPNGLKTNYKKHLNYYNGLTANAEIITDDLKLSDRIFNNLKSIFYKR